MLAIDQCRKIEPELEGCSDEHGPLIYATADAFSQSEFDTKKILEKTFWSD